MTELVSNTFKPDQVQIIKSQIAKGATDDELKMFVSIAQNYGLDPFLKEIWFIKSPKKVKNREGIWDYKRKADGSIDYSGADTLIYTSRDGYLKIAQRDENFQGILSMVVCEGDEFEIDAENYKVTHKFGAKRGPIIGAWAKVDHYLRKPVIVFVSFNEYFSDKSSTWKQYPSAMIIKVAEVFALKRQFGISGLVTREEMAHDEQVIESAVVQEQEDSKIITAAQRTRMFAIAGSETLLREIIGKYGYESTKYIFTTDYDAIIADIEERKRTNDQTN